MANQAYDSLFVPASDITKAIKASPHLPPLIKYTVLVRQAKINDSNASAVGKVLQLLTLTTSEGNQTDTLRALAQASPEQSREIWREILPHAYPMVFDWLGKERIGKDVLQITREELERLFEPSAKSSRIANTFTNLAQEAGWSILPPSIGAKPMLNSTDLKTSVQQDEGASNSPGRGNSAEAGNPDKAAIQAVVADLLASLDHLAQVDEDTSLAASTRRHLNDAQRITIRSTQKLYALLK